MSEEYQEMHVYGRERRVKVKREIKQDLVEVDNNDMEGMGLATADVYDYHGLGRKILGYMLTQHCLELPTGDFAELSGHKIVSVSGLALI